MRVATYTERTAASRGSVFALGVLLLTIMLGTGVVPTIAAFAGGILPSLMTPLWLLLYISAFLGLMFTNGINWISWLIRYRILLVLLLIGTIISVSWSVDAQVSAERVVHLIGSSLIAIYIGFSVPLLTTLRVLALVLGASMLASLGAVVALPDLGIQDYEGTRVWRGVFNSKNDLGFWAAAGVLLYVTLSESFHNFSVKALCFAMGIICLGVLYFSESATSLLALLVAGALCSYLYIAGRFQLGFIRMAIVAVLFLALTGLAIANIETSELVGRSGDLTGRGEVWRQVMKLILNHPLTGVGYGSLWYPTDATLWIQQSFFDFTWVVYHAHNGLLQVASEVGIPLALIALLMVAQQLIEIFYCQYERRQVGVLFVLGFVVAFLVSNFSEARFLITRELFWIFFLALPISMLRQINLVDQDLMPTDDLGNSGDSTPEPYGGVPGKPWLGLLPRELNQSNADNYSGYTSAPQLSYQPDATHHEEDDFELQTSTLSLTVTDIDLGEVFDRTSETRDTDSAMNEALDDNFVEERAPLRAKSAPRKPQTFDHDDTFEIDRYDIELDAPAEWVDIDLDDYK